MPTPRRLALLLLALPACQRPGAEHRHLDTPPPPVAALGPATPLERLPKISDGKAPAEPPKDDCGRGKGRDPDGKCVPLGLRDTEFVQRVQIPGGQFVMGGLPENYNGLLTREAPAVRWSGQPPRPAAVPSFWIDLHEVTRAAYAACVRDGGCTPAVCPEGQVDPAADAAPEMAGALPQTCVTHAQAAAYCEHAGARLPREAEWEYAARGVDARIYPWGNEVEDQIPNALYPAGHVREDSSYFGIRGLGSNVLEWVDEVYEADAGLRPFLREEFRDPDNPVARTRLAFERKVRCGDDPACAGPTEPPLRHVLKHASAGLRTAGRELFPPGFPPFELEGWAVTGTGPKVGFRCATDLAPGDVPLRVPASSPPVPLVRREGEFQIFGGVAEAVTQAEARRFCAALQVPDGTGETLTGWRLPAADELPALAASFRGPGPFWSEDGAVIQVAATRGPVPPDAPWQEDLSPEGSALLARCVRRGP
jgi:formylglycine-generating enzyme required for sulfatase activity